MSDETRRLHDEPTRATSEPTPAANGPLAGDLRAALEQLLSVLSPAKREVVALRAGVDGPPLTQRAIGVLRGVTESRICQVEREALRALAAERAWCDAVEHRMRALAPRSLPLNELVARDPWFAEVAALRPLLNYLLHPLYDGRLCLFDLDGHAIVATFPRAAVDAAWKELLREANGLSPDAGAIEGLIARYAAAFGDVVAERLGERFRALSTRASGRVATLEATLRVSPGPVPLQALERHHGRASLPKSAVILEGGVATLAERLDGFDALVPTVVARCRDWITERGALRQWSCTELMEALVGVALPGWFNPGVIATMAGMSTSLRRTGAQHVALASGGGEPAASVITRILREAGFALDTEALLRRARAESTSSERALHDALLERGFIEVSRGCWGLVERDLPGGALAVSRAAEEVRELLAARGRGIVAAALLPRVRHLSSAHARWSERALLSVLRSDERFCLRLGAVGLRAWGDVRCPTRRDAFRAYLERDDGKLSATGIQAHLTDVLGAPVAREVLTCRLHAVGASIRGDEITRHP